jgi:hypothetical protein
MVSINQSPVKPDVNLSIGSRGSKRRKRNSSKKGRVRKEVENNFPAFDDIKGVLSFFILPGMVIFTSLLTGFPLPKALLYGVAAVLGFYLVLRAYYSVELILAVAIIYLPFSKTFVIPIAPGLNGTNVFLILTLMAAFFQAQRHRVPLVQMLPGSKLMFGFAILSSLSAVTLALRPGGLSYFLDDTWYTYKAWIDQFILYFVVVSAIRDRELAKRVVLYTVIGSMLVILYSVNEMIERMGYSNIDKSRVEGPHKQANNFGGFVAYTLLPVIALFVMYMNKAKAWLITPYMLLALKMLIVSFSRGAYLAFAVGGFLTGYFRGKTFLLFWAGLCIVVALIFPSVIPESIMARMNSTENNVSSSSQQLDKSSQTRLVMWEAAIEMTSENPIWGKGFKVFPLLKSQYTDVAVKESDPHNMYFYISSQMGIPTLILFLLVLLNMFEMGRRLVRGSSDEFIKAVGIGGAAIAACMAVINIFGSRFINIDFTCYFFVYYAVLQYLLKDQVDKEVLEKKERKGRRQFARPPQSAVEGSE